MESEFQQFVGKSYQFDDGAVIKIVQVKLRDTGYAVTYETTFNDSLPRRLVMTEPEFISTFGHLFM